jgi:DNA helicase-2/ATP-dependent DNA helicase PcrA
MNNLLENLNSEQLKAVMHKDGPLLIIAGAGTGKTTIIAQRIAYLIEQGLAKPDEILALTFTDKAAGEMEERVDQLLPIGYLDLWISTFHGFGERILKEHGLAIGLPGGFKLLNEFEQWALIKKNLDKFNLDYYRPLGNPTKFIHALVKHFSRAKDEDISPAEYLKYSDGLKENLDNMLSGSSKKKTSNNQDTITKKISNSKIQNSKFKIQNLLHDGENNINDDIAELEIKRINEVANAYHVYQQLLLDNNAMDFGDLINYCLKLFRERPAILQKYREQFKYILLDEFQDTNWSQYELVKMLSEPKNNLVVVGDDDQSIYKFRGASVSNIIQFKNDYPQASEIVLVNNYRNTQNILDLSYNFIQLNNPNRLEWQLNISRDAQRATHSKLSKKLISGKEEAGCIEVIKGADLADEIRQVAEKIADLKIRDKEASWNDFAVLVRANDSAKDFCHFFDIAGLPYIFLSSRGLYAKPVIMDVVAYLKLLDNYHESPALYRVLNMAVFNFTYQELVNFNYWAHKKSWSLYEVLKSVSALPLGPDIRAKADKVLGMIASHTALVREKAVSEIVLAFITDSGYLKYLTGADERTSR